ncbi:flavodoxin domain-containing protein [Hoeflea sp. TYP-13]|uniref:flavodoxin domain-containing protein n=1 Tax=Hoeflea sp. TYP-13 TaxID=3230023 RepID=UPI0034C677E7
MRILLVYGTTEGQTRKIAKFCESHLTGSDNTVELLDSRRRMSDLEISKFDCVILAGSVHQRHHQESLTNFVIAHKKQLQESPTLFISVSLSIAFEGGEKEAQKYVDDFAEYTGFQPNATLLVAGALKFDQYDYYMNQIVEFVVLQDRSKITEDQEFTDWETLEEELDAFVSAV